MCSLFIPWVNFIIAIVSAGIATFALVHILQSSKMEQINSSINPTRKISYEWLWVIVIISTLVFLFSISEAFVSLGNNNSGSPSVGRAEALIGISVGVIGLVITGMTGMALSAAWRAVDKSSKALKDLKALELDITKKGLRALCYAEAINFRSHEELLGDLLTRAFAAEEETCLLYTSPSPRDRQKSRMPSSA